MSISLSTFVRDTLVNDPGLVALGIGVRVYPDQLPQNWILPSIVYRLISDVSDYAHDGSSGLANARVQLDCWGAATDLDSEALARAARIALVGKRIGPIQVAQRSSERSMGPDATTLKRRHIVDLMIWHTEDQ